jgi:hypothetical protein
VDRAGRVNRRLGAPAQNWNPTSTPESGCPTMACVRLEQLQDERGAGSLAAFEESAGTARALAAGPTRSN